MKIVSWNACCKFREKYKEVAKLDADIYIIQECENPATCKDKEYCDFVKNGYWVGQLKYKGLMVFTTRPDIKLKRLDWQDAEKRYFIPVRVNDSFNLVASWACDPYCEELQDWVELVGDNITPDTVIIGDLNSNFVLDPKHLRKTGKSFHNCVELLRNLQLEDMWHYLKKEEQGKESVPTFYLYRHLDKPFHIDHCFAHPKLVNSINIHARWEWLALSDHLPIEIDVNI
jgi:exonuclease III